MANFQEGSSRLNFPSGFDFTVGGTVFTPPLILVKFGSGGTAGKIVASAAATDKHIGVLMNCPTASGTADILSVNASGTAKMICGAGGNLSVGNFITSDSAGKAVATTTTGDLVVGIVVEAATSGQEFAFQPVFFKHP